MKKILAIIVSFTLFSCSNDVKVNEMNVLNIKSDSTQNISISRDVLDEMMRTLPSPIETANLITKSKANFNKNLLIPTEAAEKFNNKYSQALALGGYGVNLGYLNLNNKTLYVISYLESLNTLSKELKVDQFLNFSLLNDLANNRNNVDSLIQISTENFNQIDEYLRSQNRGDLSVLMLVGSWIEGLHMFNSMAKSGNDDVIKRIGEQKIIIDNMYVILKKLEHINYYKNLKFQMQDLKKVFDTVKISYVYKEPTMKEINGELVIEDNSETNVLITEQQLSQIDKEITKLRNQLFQLN